MGRCYEFSVDIVGGCGHAMVVSAAGGECECPTCGARCRGRFPACAGILAQPGYVPAIAPAWAVQRTAPPVPPPLQVGGARLIPSLDVHVAAGDAVADLRTALHGTTAGLQARILAALDAVEEERGRDAGADTELAAALHELAEGLDGMADRQVAMEQRLAEVLERLAAATPPSETPPLRAVGSGPRSRTPGVKRSPRASK